MVPYLTNKEVPPDWVDLVQKSEISSVEDYDLAKLWVESQSDSNVHLPNQEGECTTASEGKKKKVSRKISIKTF